jgi:hypothetical protein
LFLKLPVMFSIGLNVIRAPPKEEPSDETA